MTGEPIIADAGFKLHPSMKTLLETNEVAIYTMQDVFEFRLFHGTGPTTNFGAAGFSDESNKVSASFRTVLFSGSSDDTWAAYYSGTIVHELGHQLDNLWGDPAIFNSTWQNAKQMDEQDFNLPSCATAVDAVRTAQTPPLPTICQNFPPGTSNVDVLNSVLDMASDEQFARAFADAVRRANSGISIRQYYIDVQSAFGRENLFMDQVVGNGQP